MHVMNAVKTTAFTLRQSRTYKSIKSMPEARSASGRKYEVYHV